MAHADYDCCAICDTKMAYNGGAAATKEALCVVCIEDSQRLGKLVTRPEHVIEHLKTLGDDDALKWLHAMGFSPCYYENEIDKYLIGRGLVETGSKDSCAKWGNKLRPLAPVEAPIGA